MDLNELANDNEVAEVPAEAVTTETAGEETAEPATPAPVVIKAKNPNAEDMASLMETIKASYDFDVDVQSRRYTFKKSTDSDTGIETIREAVEIAVPYPSEIGIATALSEGGLQAQLVREAVNSYVDSQVRALLNDGNEGYKLNAANFPVDQLSWDFISKLPKAQRGTGIAKEIWEAFIKDYVEVMPAAANKELEAIGKQAKIIANKFAMSKTNRPVLEYMIGMLAIYADNSERAEEFVQCQDFLLSKIESFLNFTEEDLLENL